MSKTFNLILCRISFSCFIVYQLACMSAKGQLIKPDDSAQVTAAATETSSTVLKDSCISYFQKSFISPNQLVATAVIASADGGIVSVGYTKVINQFNSNGCIWKLDNKGNIAWSYMIDGSIQETLQGIKVTSDNGFIVHGFTQRNASEPFAALLMKLDADGKVNWFKRYGKSPSFGITINDVIEISDGGFTFIGTYDYMNVTQARMLVARTDRNGNTIWSKTFNTADMDMGESILEDGDNLVLSGFYNMIPGSFFVSGFITKIDKQTGSIIWSNSYNVESKPNSFHDLFATPTGYTVNCIQEQPSKKVLINVDRNGKVEKLYRLNGTGVSGRGPMIYTRDNGWVTTQGELSAADIHLYKINNNGMVEWAKQYPKAGHEVLLTVNEKVDGTLYGSGFIDKKNDGNEDAFLFQSNSKGEFPGCLPVNEAPVTDQPACQQLAMTWSEIRDIQFDLPIAEARTLTVTTPIEEIICKWDTCYTGCPAVPLCETLKILGPDLVCSLVDTIAFTTFRSMTCTSAVSWAIDTNIASIISTSDSLLTIKFHKQGTAKLVAAINSSCDMLKDSIVIAVRHNELNIGKDVQICNGSTHIFNAGAGFSSYLWQDGSADSLITVTQPGQYFVQVEDACGNRHYDTALITGYKPSPQNFLPPTKDLCKGSSIELMPAGSWSAYRWSNNSVARSITVNTQGTYWLEVKDPQGCTGRDSIQVVAKDCLQGVFFPNAFTPNNDGQNDHYIPIVHGQLEKYQLFIYNRYGEKVFASADPLRGWDGRIKGREQSSGQFVWTCVYKLSGEKEEKKKGTVLLVR